MNRPYREMTAAERLADRIAKNRRIDHALLTGEHGLSLNGIVAQLNERKQRATYAKLVGVLPRGLMSRRKRSYADSWIVAGNGSKYGWPTGYTKNETHPDCYQQICESTNHVIDDAEELRQWHSTSRSS